MSTERQQARSEAAAAKARAKAMRPWYRKKRFWLLGVVVLIGVVMAASSGGGKSPAGGDAHPAAADVASTSCTTDVIGLANATGTITNHSSKASNYSMHVSFEDPTGRRLAEGYEFVNTIAPGQAADWKAIGDKSLTKGTAVVCKILSVDRHEAVVK